MLRLVSSVSRPSSTGLLGKVAVSTNPQPCSRRHSQKLDVSHISAILHLARRSFASTSSRPADITLTVDGKEVTVPQGNILDF